MKCIAEFAVKLGSSDVVQNVLAVKSDKPEFFLVPW